MPDAITLIDEFKTWLERLDLLIILLMVIYLIKSRLGWMPKHFFFASRYIVRRTGTKGFLLSCGVPVILDLCLLPLVALFGFKWSSAPKSSEEQIKEIKNELKVIRACLISQKLEYEKPMRLTKDW